VLAVVVMGMMVTSCRISGNNLTGVSTGPGVAIPGNVANPTNATRSPSAVGEGNITNPTTANVANQTASIQSGGL
jgi:hypothetical protein